jgi:hypothetical protein
LLVDSIARVTMTGMKEDEFWRIADTFRDPRVWWIHKGQWWKDNLWGEPGSYGKVHLTEAEQARFKRV